MVCLRTSAAVWKFSPMWCYCEKHDGTALGVVQSGMWELLSLRSTECLQVPLIQPSRSDKMWARIVSPRGTQVLPDSSWKECFRTCCHWIYISAGSKADHMHLSQTSSPTCQKDDPAYGTTPTFNILNSSVSCVDVIAASSGTRIKV